ncbi:hypothetical protein FRX31_002337, partial [Thalictrum thalictroides]
MTYLIEISKVVATLQGGRNELLVLWSSCKEEEMSFSFCGLSPHKLTLISSYTASSQAIWIELVDHVI